jgi:beta-galactosidase/beta-glucuronidase
MWYRITFDAERSGGANGGATLLHFGAIDWQSAVYFNGVLLGNHTGGYSAIDFDVTAHLKATGNELLVFAHDPSEEGSQPNGKQRISAISAPGGDTYTPSSGIWQTVWMEAAPASYVAELVINQVRSSRRF